MATMTRVNPRTWSHLTNKEQLADIMETYAKNANKRLRSLERANADQASNAYRKIREFSRQNLEFMTIGRNGKMNFKRSYKERDIEEIKREIAVLDKFLWGSKTSTARGTKAHYKSIKESLGSAVDNSGTARDNDFRKFWKNMSLNEFSEWWENEANRRAFNIYGSDLPIKIMELRKEGAEEYVENFINDVVNENLTIREANDRASNYINLADISDRDLKEQIRREITNGSDVNWDKAHEIDSRLVRNEEVDDNEINDLFTFG